jgi:hypothetical protein
MPLTPVLRRFPLVPSCSSVRLSEMAWPTKQNVVLVMPLFVCISTPARETPVQRRRQIRLAKPVSKVLPYDYYFLERKGWKGLSI